MSRKYPDNHPGAWTLTPIEETANARRHLDLPRNEYETNQLLRATAAIESVTGMPPNVRIVNERPSQRRRSAMEKDDAVAKQAPRSVSVRNVSVKNLPKTIGPDGKPRLDLDALCDGLTLEPMPQQAVERTRDGTRVVSETPVTINWKSSSKKAGKPPAARKRMRRSPYPRP